MARGIPDYRAYIHHLFTEHRRINESLDTIREYLAESNRSLPSQRPRLVREFEQLHDNLAHHFAAEEEGACIEQAVSRNPNLAGEAVQLEGQHEQLLGQLREMTDTARTSALTSEAVNNIAAQFREFATALVKHETAENRILEKGFNIDLELEEH